VIVISNPTPPLDSDFSGGILIFVAEDTKNTFGLSSNGEDVVIAIADNEDNLLGLVGVIISPTECEIVMYRWQSDNAFEEASGTCRIEDEGNILLLEDVVLVDNNLAIDLKGEVVDGVSIDPVSRRAGHEAITQTELLIQEFQFEIMEELDKEN